MTLDQLPTSLKVSAPIPAFGGYIQGQKDFRRLVREDMENGKEIAFLDPKVPSLLFVSLVVRPKTMYVLQVTGSHQENDNDSTVWAAFSLFSLIIGRTNIFIAKHNCIDPNLLIRPFCDKMCIYCIIKQYVHVI